ncbi:hypothetical protein ADM96_36900 [Burkholderia sp. ST111]|nr:hypothetical protein ADM96_36900 [Burkholderia sp. ST111]
MIAAILCRVDSMQQKRLDILHLLCARSADDIHTVDDKAAYSFEIKANIFEHGSLAINGLDVSD